jgi:putative toxin-antitoxin system antitoxin component (TIGR02293 family)
MKTYKDGSSKDTSFVNEPLISYQILDDYRSLNLIQKIREGISMKSFQAIKHFIKFTMTEWSTVLHISERTINRYEKENKNFDPNYSEKIYELLMLYKFGIEVFGSEHTFHQWMDTTNPSLGGSTPKSLLDSNIGTNLIKQELGRIQHGIFA